MIKISDSYIHPIEARKCRAKPERSEGAELTSSWGFWGRCKLHHAGYGAAAPRAFAFQGILAPRLAFSEGNLSKK